MLQNAPLDTGTVLPRLSCMLNLIHCLFMHMADLASIYAKHTALLANIPSGLNYR